MTSTTARLELSIDVLGLAGQRALARADLTPPEFVAAVLDEFRELPYLGEQAENYRLLRVATGDALDAQRPLGEQLTSGEQLVLEEIAVPLPKGASAPTRPIYLREQSSGQVYRLPWLPSIIGRPDASLAGNELIAVNLTGHAAGQRVSRRHAQIVERDGSYLISSLSSNPTSIRDASGRNILVESEPVPLSQGDTIVLERSQITLTFLWRVTSDE
jgi:hypothetical protein